MGSNPTKAGAPILVTGATGRHGGSGRATVKLLLERGLPVRALVRHLDERADDLRRLGAELVVGDFADYGSLLSALESVKSAYFCYPVGAGIAEAAGLFAAAGRERGLERVVDLSLGGADSGSLSPQDRAQWVAEKIFEWAGFDGVHLRVAAYFMENVLRMDGPGIRANGRIANSFGSTDLSWIAGADVGAMAGSLLADPSLSSERTIVAGGVQPLSYAAIARTLTDVLGSPVRYDELTPDAWRQELIALFTAAGVPNARAADHLVARSIAQRDEPMPVTEHVRQLVGRAPIAFADFVALHHADFERARA